MPVAQIRGGAIVAAEEKGEREVTNMNLRAFHGDPSIKAKYLARVKMHMGADNLIRGTGWEDGRGCAVGCTLEAYEHRRYEVELGIPEWLARLEDEIFEGMSEEKSRSWPHDFLDAISPGADLEKIKGPFLIMVLSSALETFDHEKFPTVKSVIDDLIALWLRNDIGSDDWAAAMDAAWAAARAAARSAAMDAAMDAAWAARAAAWAARAAAWAAWAAARAAARSAAMDAAMDAAWAAAGAGAAVGAARAAKFDYFADELIKLLAGVGGAK